MTDQDYAALADRIHALADPVYLKFHQNLVPGVENLLGVRVPALRGLAKELARGDWRGYLAAAREDSYEETMLQGLVIGSVKADINEILPYLTAFIPKIGNWAVCDSCCSALKITAKHRDRMLEFLLPYLKSEREFEVRFAVVLLMDYYADEAYIEQLLDALDSVCHEGYYVKMAVAWAISVCFVKLPQRTEAYLQHNTLDDFTYNKALQKIVESSRVDNDTKKLMRSRKRRAL